MSQRREVTYIIHVFMHLCNVNLLNTNHTYAKPFIRGYTDEIVTKT